MALTVDDCNLILQRRCANYLDVAGLSAANGDFVDPIRWALSLLGVEAAGAVSVADADLTTVTGRKVDALLDLAEARLLQTVLTNLTRVDTRAGMVQQDFSDLAAMLRPIAADRLAAAGKRHADLLVAPVDGTGDKVVRLWSV